MASILTLPMSTMALCGLRWMETTVPRMFTLPMTYYIGLSTSAPAINGTGVNEPSTDAGYARVKLSSLGEPVDGVVTNSQAINFNESTASWGTITHFVIYDSATVGEGNLLMYGTLSTPRSVETATIMTIKEGYLSLSAQNPT